MPVPPDWKAAAVAITPGFEVEGDPYQGASGNFDGMGISCGALQWNIGSKSLQPMVIAVGKSAVLSAMTALGQQMWDACNTTVPQGLAIVNSWQNGTKLKPAAKTELQKLMGSAPMRAEQDRRIDQKIDVALKMATDWSASAGGTTAPTKRMFCWFFDIVTQNGDMKGIKRKEVLDFIAQNQPDKTDDLVCDFLEGKKGTSGHVNDAKKNGALWRNKAADEKLELLTMSYLRSAKSLAEWRHVVLNRKGTIAMGQGNVNGTLWKFAKHGL